ncbi:PREDICTED: uncharacterized protein LOC107333048 [Acropora digitifera]|uniref:uncharacterized protein LOC107333048 n=1 Tax=Acropora digitifera TaxID=70779 RepID=UPI00077A5835|nr:PREDICTED: uncharacterized protein LOC107333048 [Acropora digitifera]
MKKPDDGAAVHRLICLVKYLSKFLSDLSQICEPIRRLTHKDVPWTKEQDAAFNKIKGAVTYAPVLKYFDSSKPTEVDHLKKKTARSIITRLKRHFSNHGIPNLFQSDNGPPFDSQEFRDFAAAYEFEVVTSSPNYPQSNGRVENAVKTAKQLMKKSKQTDKNTSSNSNKSFETYDNPGVREKLQKKKERQTYYYNRGTRELSPLRKGNAVVMLPNPQARKWEKAQVEAPLDVRSYAVRTEDGRDFRRNRRHLKTYDPPPVTHTPGSRGWTFKEHGYRRRSGKGL